MNFKNIIYTDGASSGNPGPGGWGAVIRQDDVIIEIGGGEKETTNNRMEMAAAINALKTVKNNQEVIIYTDSQYLINGITQWVFGWQKNDWKTKEKKDVLNKDLWLNLVDQVKGKKIKWVAVKGHSNLALNNRVDEVAVSYSKNLKNPEISLFNGAVSDYPFQVIELEESEIESAKAEGAKNKSSKNQKAYSYLSMVDGKIEKHTTWPECKARVDGQKGARFRKSISQDHEEEIIKSWQS